MEPGRCFPVFLILCQPLSPAVPAGRAYVSTSVTVTLSTSCGSVTLSNDPGALPSIQPGYFATAPNRMALVHGVRRVLQLMLATKALEPYIKAETLRLGLPPLHRFFGC